VYLYNALLELHDDHLGSTAITADGATGSKLSELRYKPWGEIRYASQPTMTSLRYTGQRMEGIGLYDYGARWFDASSGRFVQADTIVPNPGDSQAWDRYAAMNNNPVKFVDPTGQMADQGGGGGAFSMGEEWWKKRQEKLDKAERAKNTPNLTERILKGESNALIDLLTPSHIGSRGQIELSLSIPDLPVGLSGSVGVNGVYNRISDELVFNVDWALEPGFGIGEGISDVVGPLIGWGSSSVDDVTKGFSGIGSGTVAAGPALSLAITTPLDATGLHVDPYSGQVPFTLFGGVGAGGGYASIGGGVNGQLGIRIELTPLLPWHKK
jgi:RHS repeat-associated protein